MMYNYFDSVLICSKSKTMLLFCRILLQDTLNCGKNFMSAILESNYHIVWKLSKIGVNRAVGCKTM